MYVIYIYIYIYIYTLEHSKLRRPPARSASWTSPEWGPRAGRRTTIIIIITAIMIIISYIHLNFIMIMIIIIIIITIVIVIIDGTAAGRAARSPIRLQSVAFSIRAFRVVTQSTIAQQHSKLGSSRRGACQCSPLTEVELAIVHVRGGSHDRVCSRIMAE